MVDPNRTTFGSELVYYARIIFIVNASISFTLFPVIFYLIITQSKSMKTYKWYLLNSVVTCEVFELLILTTKCDFLFPSPCIIYDAIVPIPKQTIPYAYGVIFVFWVNQGLAILWCVVYRFTQSFPGKIQIFFENSPWIYPVYISFYVIFYFLMAMAFGDINMEEKAKQKFLTDNPDLVALSNEIILCFGDRQKTINACFGLNILIIAMLLTGIAILVVMFYRIQSTKTTHITTYKLQIMLLRALTVQLLTCYVFFLVPCFVGTLVVYRGYEGGKALLLVFIFLSFHAWLEFIGILYYIKPYRQKLFQMLRFEKAVVTSITVSAANTASVVKNDRRWTIR